MTPEERDRLVRAESAVDVLRADLSEVKSDVKVILAKVNQAAGGLRVGHIFAGVIGGIASFAVGIFVVK